MADDFFDRDTVSFTAQMDNPADREAAMRGQLRSFYGSQLMGRRFKYAPAAGNYLQLERPFNVEINHHTNMVTVRQTVSR